MRRSLPELLPWVVAESLALRVLQLRPGSLGIADDRGGRMRRTLSGLSRDPALRWDLIPGAGLPAESVECLVWVGDGETVTGAARRRILKLAVRCTGQIFIAEPDAANSGVGRALLSAMDPTLVRLRSDEVPDGLGGTRTRRPWESSRAWSVASVASWRFVEGAESARHGFVTSLQRAQGLELLVLCRRLLQRWPTAYEVLVLAGQRAALCRDRRAAHALVTETQLMGTVPAHVLRAMWQALGPELWPLQRSEAGPEVSPSNVPAKVWRSGSD